MLIASAIVYGLLAGVVRTKKNNAFQEDHRCDYSNGDIIEYVSNKYGVPPFPQLPQIPAKSVFNIQWHTWVATKWLFAFNTAYRQTLRVGSLLDWDYNTNLTTENGQRLSDYGLWRITYLRPWREQARMFRLELLPPVIGRQILIVRATATPINLARSRELMLTHRSLQRIYNTGKVQLPNGKYLQGEPDLAHLMHTSRDPNLLLWAWKSWRDAVGPKIKKQYMRFIELQNEAARSGGHSDMGEAWRRELNIPNLEALCEDLYNRILPLYRQLHAYVRRKLVNYYGKDHVNVTGSIPAHLLGNMWAQEWDGLGEIVAPYPQYPPLDVTSNMQKLNMTPLAMFKLAEDFFLSIGMDAMTKKFWKYSMLERPSDGREVACHGSSTDFFDGQDYRIRMCTQVTMKDLNIIHHEMGHVEYFMQYSHQPILYQDGANSAFHEAVGDTIQYSFLTPKHLHDIGLLFHLPKTKEEDINFLMKQALMKLPLIPYSLVIDKWRWELFRGDIDSTTANQRWWQLRMKYQGVKAPIPRTENDFDPGAKYHIPDNTPYIRYFIGSFIQVQFHRALCMESNKENPPTELHKCSIYGSQRAGNLLKSVLSLGSSKPWQTAMFMFTKQHRVLADAILQYYDPLYRWLKYENTKNAENIGW